MFKSTPEKACLDGKLQPAKGLARPTCASAAATQTQTG